MKVLKPEPYTELHEIQVRLYLLVEYYQTYEEFTYNLRARLYYV